MMWLRGIPYLKIIFLIILISFPVQGIQPHENFEEADDDLHSIIAFLADIKLLCEESIEYALSVNCDITINQSIYIDYSQNSLNLSIEKSKKLDDKLSYSYDILNKIESNVGSYQYLKDILIPMKTFGLNVSSFTAYHDKIIANLTKAVDFITKGEINETNTLLALSGALSATSQCKNNVNNIEKNIDEINKIFSKATFEGTLSELYQLLDTYEDYINSLIGFFPNTESILLLYIDEQNIYLGDEINVYGYFIADNGFVADHIIELNWDDTIINTTLTDSKGRYNFTISILLDSNPGPYNVITSTKYNNTHYLSNVILITVLKIPTNITYSVPTNHYYINKLINFTGELTDYKNRGIGSNVSLHFAGFIIPLITDNNGIFNYMFNETLSFGRYPAYISFNPENTYESCESQSIYINIDTPTNLTLITSSTKTLLGEDIKLYGRLVSNIDNSTLTNKTISMFLNDKKIGSINTNKSGFYNLTYSTENFNEGTYTLYSRFNSDETEWRSSSSEIIKICLITGFFDTAILAIGIISVITGIAILIFYLKKKSFVFLKKERPSPKLTIPSSNIISKLRPSGKNNLEKNEMMIDSYTIQDSNLKYGIVSQYRLLLRFLSSRGIAFTSSNTHLDIRNKLLEIGLPKKTINDVTKTFEIAVYSPYPIYKEDIIVFDKNIFSVLTNFGG